MKQSHTAASVTNSPDFMSMGMILTGIPMMVTIPMINSESSLAPVTIHSTILWTVPAPRAVHPIRRFDPPEDSDRIRPENWPTRLSHRSAAGHLFQKPTPADRSRFSSPKSEKTRSDRCAKNFQQKFPESGRNFQNPAIFSRFRPQISRFRLQISRF